MLMLKLMSAYIDQYRLIGKSIKLRLNVVATEGVAEYALQLSASPSSIAEAQAATLSWASVLCVEEPATEQVSDCDDKLPQPDAGRSPLFCGEI